MGTWSKAPFGNDAAADWVYKLEQAVDDQLIRNTLAQYRSDSDDDLQEVIAAANVVASAAF